MKVVIMCGGQGARLREETEYRPKPMVHIGQKPILWHIMKIYSFFGFNEFVLALGYKGEMIKNYFLHYEALNNDFTIELGRSDRMTIHQRHEEIGWKITMVDTGENTLKGGRLKRLEPFLDGDSFMMTYGDGLARIDLHKLLAYHESHGRMVTMTAINPVSRFGELRTRGNTVVGFREKPKGKDNLVNGGFFVMNRKIMDYLTLDEDCDLEIGPLETIAAQEQLMIYRHHDFWACMDTLRDMVYLNDLWQAGRAEWHPDFLPASGVAKVA